LEQWKPKTWRGRHQLRVASVWKPHSKLKGEIPRRCSMRLLVHSLPLQIRDLQEGISSKIFSVTSLDSVIIQKDAWPKMVHLLISRRRRKSIWVFLSSRPRDTTSRACTPILTKKLRILLSQFTQNKRILSMTKRNNSGIWISSNIWINIFKKIGKWPRNHWEKPMTSGPNPRKRWRTRSLKMFRRLMSLNNKLDRCRPWLSSRGSSNRMSKLRMIDSRKQFRMEETTTFPNKPNWPIQFNKRTESWIRFTKRSKDWLRTDSETSRNSTKRQNSTTCKPRRPRTF